MNRKSIFLFITAIILSLIAIFFFGKLKPTAPIAEIYIDDELYKSVDISNISSPYEIPVVSIYGSNTVLVGNGYISIISSDCPDKLCVSQGKISNTTKPIICLPHHLVVKIVDNKNSTIDIIS